MALSPGMFERLEKLVSKKDEHLVLLVLERGRRRYGYLREIRPDFYVFAEVQKDGRGAIKPLGESRDNPHSIFLYREISPDELPGSRISLAV